MPLPRPRISIATAMMLVLTAAAASGMAAQLFSTKFADAIAQASGIARPVDTVAVLLLAIVLTALALAARKRHTANQALLQITASCLGFLFVFSLEDLPSRLLLYWLQILFAVLVVGPLLARRVARERLARGARRTWWMRTSEAIAFGYLNMLLVGFGVLIEALGIAAFR